ncbi:MAG TPA: sugar-transfer associated ATP-grasp domain-containing protein [Clostridia bacterium]|nr:sugar-transfer associated ATP-grasp domain-containing protein [Clostridia bacterium]
MKISRLFQIQWKNVFNLSRELAKRSGRNPMAVFLDFLWSYKTRGASWWNYMNFGFHFQKDPEVRDSFATEYKDNIYMNRYCNSPEMLRTLMDKGEFNKHYKEFLGRDYLDLRLASEEEFHLFLKRHGEVVIKPAFDMGGSGIEKLSAQEAKGIYTKLKEEKKFLVEEVLKQHPEMSSINASSINTLRTCTCIDKEGKITILYMVLRIGRKDSFIDNMSAGGLFTKITMDGQITHPCYSAQGFGSIYTHHPDTKLPFIGIQVPMIKEVKNFAIKLAEKNPDARYVGWDIAITPQGPVVIEGNDRPSCDLPQTYIHLDSGRGLVEEYERALSIKLPRSRKG